jgi:hypothetical protein
LWARWEGRHGDRAIARAGSTPSASGYDAPLRRPGHRRRQAHDMFVGPLGLLAKNMID